MRLSCGRFSDVPFLFALLLPSALSLVDVPCLTPEGARLPHAADCDNILSQVDCNELFPQTSKDPFSPKCLDDAHEAAAALCKKNCLTCCRQDKFNCYDDPKSPINCAAVDCSSTRFTAALEKYCPATCGFCVSPTNNNTCTDDSRACANVQQLCDDIDHGEEVRAKCEMTCGVCKAPACRTCLAASISFPVDGAGGKPMDHDVIDQRGPCATRTLACIGKSATIEWNNGARGITRAKNGILLVTLMCAKDGSGWLIPPDLTHITQAECATL